MALTGKIMDFFADKAMTIPAFPRTKIKAVSDDSGVGLDAILEYMYTDMSTLLGAKQEKHKPISASLSTSGWSNMTQTVSVSGVTANSTVVVTPAPASHAAYGESGVYCSTQANGTLTFTCSDTPSANLTVNVLILN